MDVINKLKLINLKNKIKAIIKTEQEQNYLNKEENSKNHYKMNFPKRPYIIYTQQ